MHNRINNIVLFFIIFLIAACVEKYDFEVPNRHPGIVIEASISDRSPLESKYAYLSEERYFKVKLGKTSNVTNVNDEVISHAQVEIETSTDLIYTYTEDEHQPGTYYLLRRGVAARPGVEYRLKITLPTGQIFQSAWEKLPIDETYIGDISTKENTQDRYVYIKPDDRYILTHHGLDVFVKIPENESKQPVFYRWNFEPLWIFKAPKPSVNEPFKTCWITTPYYLNQFILTEDQAGDYDQKLFFIDVKKNHRFVDYFSVLAIQSVMSEGYYYFWKDLHAQGDKGGLFDQPPFSLPTNFTSLNSDWTVHGYFGVVAEDAVRWKFSFDDVSYNIENSIDKVCNDPSGLGVEPGPECFNCLEYPFGNSTNEAPWWW